MIQQETITIEWKECFSYEDARDFYSCVYIHEWDRQAYYVGFADKSVFGGSQRNIGGRRRAPRYSSSYTHWINGCLERGARLFIGTWTFDPVHETNLKNKDVIVKYAEKKLIDLLDPPANIKKGNDYDYKEWHRFQEQELDKLTRLKHIGDVPEYLRQ